MTVRFIAAEAHPTSSVRCEHCWDYPATRIELTNKHEHNPEEHLILCDECTHLAGLKTCSSCEMSHPIEAKTLDGTLVYLMPAYDPEELGDGRHCCKHP